MIKPQYIISILLFFPLLLVQTTIVQLLAIDTVIPDLILILLVYYSISQGSEMIAKTMAGFTAGYFSSENKRDQYLISYNFALIVLLASLIDSTINAFFSSITFTSNIFLLFFQYALLPAIYTAAIALMGMIFYPKRKMF